jgi:hypothetical protein
VGKKGCLAIIFSIIFIVGASTQANAFWELLFHYGMYAGQAITKFSKENPEDEATRSKGQKLEEKVKAYMSQQKYTKSGLETKSVNEMIEIMAFNEKFSAIAYGATFIETATGITSQGVMVALIHLDSANKSANFYNEVGRFRDMEAYNRNRTTMAEQFASLLKNDAIKAKPQSAETAQPNAPNPAPGN